MSDSDKMLKCSFICISFFVCGSIAARAPFITPCTQTDFDCMLSSAKAALPHIVNGVPDLGMPSLDPLHGEDIITNSGGLYLAFTDLVARGLGQCTINKVERDAPKFTGFLDITCPLTVVGNYTAKGKMLFLDVEGQGPFEIKGGEMHGNITIKMKPSTRNGQKHYKITGFDFRYEPLSRFHFNFQNLFNGDQSKAEPVMKVMNESWKDIILDSNIGKPIIQAALGQLVKIINIIFHEVPANELEIA